MKTIEEIEGIVQHKNAVKTTTTLKFKRDIWNFLLEHEFPGDILEVGCDIGNTTYVLGNAAKRTGKTVFAMDIDPNRLQKAKELCTNLNCEFIQKG
jgi:predicted O-methyltransferase YrrM